MNNYYLSSISYSDLYWIIGFWVAEQSARFFCPFEKTYFRDCFSTADVCLAWSVKHISNNLNQVLKFLAFISEVLVIHDLQPFLESQYYWVWKGRRRWPCPPVIYKAWAAKSSCSGLCLVKLSIFPRVETTTLLGILFQGLYNEFFCLMLKWNFFYYSLCPLPLALLLNVTESDSIIFISTFSYTLVRLLGAFSVIYWTTLAFSSTF